MDINTLRSLVSAGLSGTDYTLNLTTLDAPALTTLANDILPDATLHLSAATLQASSDGQSIIVNGTGVDFPFSEMQCSAQFSILNDVASLQLSAIGDQSWHFSTSFPGLNGSIGEDMSFAESFPPTLYLSSDPANGRPVGLWFKGSIDLNAMTSGLSSLLGRQYQDFSGPFVLTNQGETLSSFDLTGTVASGVNLGVVQNATLSAGITGWSATSPYDGWNYTLLSLVFGATIPFTAQGVSHMLPVTVTIPDLQGPFRFSTDLTDLVDALVDEIQALLQKFPLGDLLPKGNFQLQKYLSLSNFFFDLNPTASQPLTIIGVDVENAQPWTIIHLADTNKDWVLDKTLLAFRIMNPGSSGSNGTLFISGELKLGEAGVLLFNTSFPDWSFNLSLQEETTLNLTEVLEELLGNDAGIPDLQIETFDMDIDASQYALDLILLDDWGLDDFLWITEVTLHVEHQTDGTTQAAVAGIFCMSQAEITITADYPGNPNTGWQFAGSTGPVETIPIGSLIENLALLFSIDTTFPASLAELIIENLNIQFDTLNKNFSFSCEAQFPISDNLTTDIVITISLIKNTQGQYTKTFGGTIMIGSRQFQLYFSQDPTSTSFIATYAKKDGEQILIKEDLIAPLSDDLAAYIPAGLEIDLKDILFIFTKNDTGSTFLFGLDISATLPSLSNLPLVGKELPTDQSITVNNLQLLVVSQDVQQSLVERMNVLIPTGITHLTATDLSKGLAVTASMTFGSTPQILSVPVVGSTTTGTTPPPQPGVTAADNAKWFTLQKSFGPVHFNRIGLQYKDSAVWFLLDAALTALGLTISLDGLAFGSSLTKFTPEFDLHGLGINYTSGDVLAVTGAFLNAGNEEFIGEALIKTSELTISALGSYASLNGDPSLFVYAFLDQPIGGPSFFFVTGLAAGFGYNRALIIPPIEQVSQFPLIEEVMSGTHLTLGQELQALDHYIPPSVGEFFFALGVRFTSFKIIESFALLTVELGNRVEIAILGLSTLISPPPEKDQTIPPLAEIYMALRASFAPDEGFLSVNAQLTSASYLFSKDCHLVGGYAFYSWFRGDHAGDFVMTLGGYHPAFVVPNYYPQVPRAGFSWQVNEHLLMKGGLYFALTSSAIMAGGNLEVTWDSGSFKAWFSAGADFLLAWKPYHYDASFYVNVGASYTFELAGTHHITVDVGASVHVWGPDFTGLAHIDLSIISFDIAFGSGSSQAPTAIDWPTFETSFLPASDSICSIAVKSGLVSTPQTGTIQWVVNAKDFNMVIGTVIPITNATFNQQPISDAPAQSFGIASMEVTSDDLVSQFAITITKDNKSITEDDFECLPVLKNMPVALWGQELQPNLNAAAFIPNALAGFTLHPKQPPTTGDTVIIDPTVLSSTPDPLTNVYAWQSPITFNATTDTEEERRTRISETIAAPATVSARATLLDALSLNVPIDVSSDVASTFLLAPQIAVV